MNGKSIPQCWQHSGRCNETEWQSKSNARDIDSMRDDWRRATPKLTEVVSVVITMAFDTEMVASSGVKDSSSLMHYVGPSSTPKPSRRGQQ